MLRGVQVGKKQPNHVNLIRMRPFWFQHIQLLQHFIILTCVFPPPFCCLDSRYHVALISHRQHCTAPVPPKVNHTHPVARVVDYMVQYTCDMVLQNPSSPCVYPLLSWFKKSWNDWCLYVKVVSTNKHKCLHRSVFMCWTMSVFRWITAFSVSYSFLVFRYFWISGGVICQKESEYILLCFVPSLK